MQFLKPWLKGVALGVLLVFLVVTSVQAAQCEYGTGGCGGKSSGSACTIGASRGSCALTDAEKGECSCVSGSTISNLNKEIFKDEYITGLKYAPIENPGEFITAAWPYLFATAGLILFAMLVWGSLEVMFGAATPKSAESGKQRITNAVIGFILLFSVFWMGQLIQQIFGINFAVGQEVAVTEPDPGGSGGGGGGGDEIPDSTPPAMGAALVMNPNGTLQVCAGGYDERIGTIPVSLNQSLTRNNVALSIVNFPVAGVFNSGDQILRCSIFDVGQTARDLVNNELIPQLQSRGISGLETSSSVTASGQAGVATITLTPTLPLTAEQISQAQVVIQSFPDYAFTYQFQTDYGTLPAQSVVVQLAF